ncbi:GNAT superfamily N-acetyltransferase [Arthrobacter sp. CAN_A214]
MATASHYGFLNIIEGLTHQTVELLSEVLKTFPEPDQVTIVAASPSQMLADQLLGEGYAPASVRPIAYQRLSTSIRVGGIGTDAWQVQEVSTRNDTTLFLDLLEVGYAATSEIRALIRAEHALPMVRGFIAFRNEEPLAVAAMSLHPTGAVLGGASTLPAARGRGAQTALLSHRVQLARTLGLPLVTATAAPGTPSIRNLAKLGFTIVERTGWCLNDASRA